MTPVCLTQLFVPQAMFVLSGKFSAVLVCGRTECEIECPLGVLQTRTLSDNVGEEFKLGDASYSSL